MAVALNLSKTCRLLRISVYAPRGEQRFQRIPRSCQSLLAHATHIQGDESVAEQAAMKSPSTVDVLWVDLFKQRLIQARTDRERQKYFSFPFKDNKQTRFYHTVLTINTLFTHTTLLQQAHILKITLSHH